MGNEVDDFVVCIVELLQQVLQVIDDGWCIVVGVLVVEGRGEFGQCQQQVVYEGGIGDCGGVEVLVIGVDYEVECGVELQQCFGNLW